jgi:hypothetical protein
MSNKWEGRLKKGLRGILSQDSSKFDINRTTFKNHIHHYGLEKASEVHYMEKIMTGAVLYLNVKSQLILTLFGHVLDSLD